MKVLILLAILPLFTSTLFSQDEIEEADYALKGINQIYLTITIYPDAYPRLGLTESEVYGNVSYLLRKDGVEVFANEQRQTPQLNISFGIYQKNEKSCDLNIKMAIFQEVIINSNKVKTTANTWTRIFDGRNVYNKYQVEEILEGICKDFINILLAINPKR